LSALAVVTDGSGGPQGGTLTVGSTPVVYALTGPGSSPNVTENIQVYQIDVSVADPSAVLEIVVGRVEVSSGGATGGAYFRGNTGHDSLPGLATHSFNTFQHVHGRYFLSGGHPLQLKFDEPIEALVDWQSSTDMAVAVWIKRVDSSTAVGFHLNTRYEVCD
jgi:hypothetical protein